MRTSARYAGAAAALAAVLLVSGCGGDGASDGPDPKRTAQETTEPAEGTGNESSDSAVDGTWGTEDGADALVLSVHGDQAALLGRTACSGTADTGADPVTFTLECTDGSTDRTEGTVKSVDGKSLTVAWESGTTDTFSKVEVPTEAIDLPTDPGDLLTE